MLNDIYIFLNSSNCDLDIDSAFKLINTTSPSYPMLMTIEANINYLNSKKGREKIEALMMNY